MTTGVYRIYRRGSRSPRDFLGRVPPHPEEDDLFRLCVSCRAAEGTMERADGEYICASCYADAADYAYDRAREIAKGDRR